MYFVFTIELNLLLSCFGLSALYTRIYRNSWPSPPAQHPSSTAGVSSIEWRRASPLPFSLLAVYLFYAWRVQYVYAIKKGRTKETCNAVILGKVTNRMTSFCPWLCIPRTEIPASGWKDVSLPALDEPVHQPDEPNDAEQREPPP